MRNPKFQTGDRVRGVISSIYSTGRVLAVEGDQYRMFWAHPTAKQDVQFKLFDITVIDTFYEKIENAKKEGLS